MLGFFVSAVVGAAAGAGSAVWITSSKFKTIKADMTHCYANFEAIDSVLTQHTNEIDLSYREMLEEFARINREIKALDSSAAQKTGAMLQPVAKALAEVRETVGLS